MYTNNYLKDKSYKLPNDGSRNDPRTSLVTDVCQQLSMGLPSINCGGCGMFAAMLDSIFNGSIVQLRYVEKENPLNIFGYDFNWHEIFINDGLCYDAFDTCTLTSLFRVKHIKGIISIDALKYQIKSKRFFLIRRDSIDILRDYQDDWYYPMFANKVKMGLLYNNFQNVVDTLPKKIKSKSNPIKIKNIFDSYEPIVNSLAA